MNKHQTFVHCLLVLLLICFRHTMAQQVAVNTASGKVDILHSRLDLQVDWEKKQLKGSATIRLVLLKPAATIHMDAGFLTLLDVRDGEGQPLRYQYDGKDAPGGLAILLGKTLPAKSRLTLQISYHTNQVNETDPNNLGGSLGKGPRFIRPTRSLPQRRRQLWAQGEPEGNKYWYPCIESTADLRTTELLVTVTEPLTVISNGTLAGIADAGNGMKLFHYSAQTAYPNALTSLVVGEYVAVQQYYKGKSFDTYCYPDEAAAATASADRLTDMAAYFSDYTGMPYPYSRYTQVMVQEFPFPGPTGSHMASLLSDNFVDDARTHKDFLYLWDGVEAEALAAQWFGNLVATQNWEHAWLPKALAHFLEGKYGAWKNGREEYLLWHQDFDVRATKGDWQSGIRHPLVVKKIDNLDQFLWGDNYLRSRGALILHLLELELGEANFRKALQYFVKANRNKAVTTKAFQQAIAYSTHREMDWFFRQWVYNTGQPVFEVDRQYDSLRNELVIHMHQVQKTDSIPPGERVAYFQGKMQLEVDGILHTVQLRPQALNTFRFPVQKRPDFININYESRWIAEIRMPLSLRGYLAQFRQSRDVLARVAALNELAGLYQDSATSDLERQTISKALWQEAAGNSYWRFRMTVLSVLNRILPRPLATEQKALLVKLIQQEQALLKANAISVLGNERDSGNAELFIQQLQDSSDRVIFAAAVALGKSKSPRAFEALVNLKDKPSWKGQSKMAALTGLQGLGDSRAVPVALDILRDNQSPRWFLGTGGWDYPVYAATTLAAFGKGSLGYEMVRERFRIAMADNDLYALFSQLLLVSILGDPRGAELFQELKQKYKGDAGILEAIDGYEAQFNSTQKR